MRSLARALATDAEILLIDEALSIGDRISILRDGAVIQDGDPQDIIMKPADDYIADFVKDINRARVIEVRSVMEKANQCAGGPKLTPKTTIEDALQAFNDENSNCASVVCESGNVIGKLDLNQAIAAMVRPEQSAGDSARYT